MKRIILVALAATLSLAISAKTELKTVTFKVEQMVCHNCEAKVKKNIAYEKGVKKISTDVEHHLVTITYNPDKTNVKTLQDGFKKFGYNVVEAQCQKSCGQCPKTEGQCCKKAEGQCKKDGGQCPKAEGQCCKKGEGQCKKDGSQCPKAEGQCQKKAEGKCCKK